MYIELTFAGAIFSKQSVVFTMGIKNNNLVTLVICDKNIVIFMHQYTASLESSSESVISGPRTHHVEQTSLYISYDQKGPEEFNKLLEASPVIAEIWFQDLDLAVVMVTHIAKHVLPCLCNSSKTREL